MENKLMFSFIIASVDIFCKDKAAQHLLSKHVSYYFFYNHGVQECERSQKPRAHYWSKRVRQCKQNAESCLHLWPFKTCSGALT